MLTKTLPDVTATRYMKPQAQLTAEMVLRVIEDELENEFNSHELLEAVQRVYPNEYAEELIKKASTDDPAKHAGSALAARLNFAPFDKAVVKVGTEWARNARGTMSRLPLWRKSERMDASAAF